MEKYKENEGVWRTVRGRRIFIAKGEDLVTAMKKSGKFENLKREDVQKAKKQLKVDEAKEKWNKEYNPKNYSNPKYKDEKQREKLRQRQDKANKNLEKAYADRDDFMATYDDKRDENELSWQDKVARNTREANKKAKEIEAKHGKGEYMFHEDKWQDDYYGTFREKEEKNARVKEEPDDAPYESVEAYKGFKAKADALDKTGKPWYGEVYTNDEFMEHLEDANWHTERKMIEEAGLTNKQLRELKKNVKLDRYSADLDREKTQKLIDKVKKEFPSDDDKIKSFKEKKQSNNKVNYISKEEYDKTPKDYKGTLKELINTAEFRGENKQELIKKYQDMGYDVENDKTILKLEKGGTTLTPVKIKNDEKNNQKKFLENNDMTETEYQERQKEFKNWNKEKKEIETMRKNKELKSKGLTDEEIKKGYTLPHEDKIKDDETRKKVEEFVNKKQSNNATSKYKETKRIGFGGYNNDDIPVYNNQIDYTGDFTRANLSKLSNEELTTALNKQRELYKNVVSEKIGDQRTRNGKMDKIFNTARKLQYEKGVKLLEQELKKRKGE